jgi:Secretion system C-terminal sorting domain
MKIVLLFVLMGLGDISLLAQWSTDPNVNNAICTTASQQQAPRIVSDGSGGAIITWWDYNLLTADYNIYAQRINSDGILQWAVNGVAICTNPLLNHVPEIISDGSGGAIITWQDNRSGNCEIYAQKINSGGVVQWTIDGVSVGNATNCQTFPQLISDGSGGAIVTWQDLRNGSSYVIYAQRINANGVNQWAAGGVVMHTTSSGNDELPQIISDGNGGAIIAWHEYVNPPGQFDIYAQQINANGITGWGSSGISICGLTSNQLRPQLISDGSNGAIIVWEDYRNAPTYSNLYAQKVNAGGVIQWTLNGVDIAPNTLHQLRHKLLSDGSGGAFITWQYSINLVYAQRINSAGVTQWASDGVSIGAAGDSRFPQIVTDGGTGAIITWYDYRGSGNGDIFAQHINSAGTVLWPVNGASVCRDPSGQIYPRLVENGSGGAILTWEDSRNSGTNSSDVYAQQITASGTLGIVTGVNENEHSLPATFTLGQNYPNPFNLNTKISFAIAGTMFVSLKVYNIFGQEVSTLVNGEMSEGSYAFMFDATGLPGGVYIYRMTAGRATTTRAMILMK